MHSVGPLVSIIIPCFLKEPVHASFLEETIESVSRQTVQDFEVIIVDDGSPLDPSPAASRFPKTRLLRQRNTGSALARNTGIASARGSYFVFLDADDLLLPAALEAGLAALAAHPECGFAIGPREEMHYDGSPVSWSTPAMPLTTALYRILLGFEWYIIPPSSAMFRGEVVQRLGGFRDPWGSDDLDFYLRASRLFLSWCYDEPAVTHYRRYSASSSRDGERMLHSMREVYRREWPFVKDDPELVTAWREGRRLLTEIFRDCLAENLSDRVKRREWRRAARAGRQLLLESPRRLWRELGAPPTVSAPPAPEAVG